jgi:NAD dependent epimerase/dehydratase
MRKALVTGAGGFIGSHLVETLLAEGIEVRAFVHYNSRNSHGNLEFLAADARSAVEIVAGDIQDPFLVRRAVKGVDTVFHLAALIGIPYSYVAPAHYAGVNVMGTLNVLQAALDEGVPRVVHTSTSETYGTAQYVPIDERHPLQGQSPYSASKIGADKLAESYHLSFGLPLVTVRPFNAYGPRQSARAIIPAVISQAVAGQDKIQLGSLTPVRDLTYVADTVRGFIAAAHSDRAVGRVVNLGQGSGISIGELVARILKLCGSNASIVSDRERIRPEKSEVMQLVCDNTAARELLGWQPSIGLDEGLSRVIAFIREHRDLYKPSLYNI